MWKPKIWKINPDPAVYHQHQEVKGLVENDFDKRIEFSDAIVEITSGANDVLERILWTDEEKFQINGLLIDRNVFSGVKIILILL